MFAKFAFLKPVRKMMPFRTFKTHSLKQITRSLSKLDVMALLNLAERFLIREVW